MAFSVAIVISPGGTRFRWNRPSAARVSVSESQACSRPIEKRVPSGSESRSNNFNRPASRCQGRIARSPARCWRSFVDPGELVTPQTFGGTRGPSSSLVAVANLQDLQIEVDIDESKLARVSLGQRCVISPVSYPDKRYQGQVAEIAPEANRAKGTVQVKVQILEPDHCLTPELSATVDFLGAAK